MLDTVVNEQLSELLAAAPSEWLDDIPASLVEPDCRFDILDTYAHQAYAVESAAWEKRRRANIDMLGLPRDTDDDGSDEERDERGDTLAEYLGFIP